MRRLLIAAEVQKLITVAHDAFPLFFKQCLQLCKVLDNDAH